MTAGSRCLDAYVWQPLYIKGNLTFKGIYWVLHLPKVDIKHMEEVANNFQWLSILVPSALL